MSRRDWTLVYDGDCALCIRCVEVLRRWDRRGHFTFLALQDERIPVLLPRIPRASLESAMHLLAPGGDVLAGAAALPAILRLVPGGRLVAVLFAIPGARWALDRLYRLVARNRHRLGCVPESDAEVGAHRPAGYVPGTRNH